MRSLAICTTKNEAPYLLEWLSYYKTIGFTNCLIVTNNNTDCSIEILSRLQSTCDWINFLEHDMSNSDGAPQAQAIRLATRWIKETNFRGLAAVLDADEFLYLKAHSSVEEFFHSFHGADCILLNWRIYGSSGHFSRLPGLVIERFTYCAPEDFYLQKEFKSLFRVDDGFRRLGLHFPRLEGSRNRTFVFSDGQISDKRFLSERPYRRYSRIALDTAQVNHYAIKSHEEFSRKKARGRGAAAKPSAELRPRHTDAFFEKHDQNYVYMPMPDRLLKNVRDKMEELYMSGKLAQVAERSYFGL